MGCIYWVLFLFMSVTPPAVDSFEKYETGSFTDLPGALGCWIAKEGHAAISEERARTGKKALRLFGGERSVLMDLPPDAEDTGEITFWAERRTEDDPFRFRVEVKVKAKWEELYNGDETIRVGGFHVRVRIPLTEKEHCRATRFRFSCVSPEGSGVLIDDVCFVPAGSEEEATPRIQR